MGKILKAFEGFTIWSSDYKALAKWYQDTFELKVVDELNMPLDYAFSFEIEEGNKMLLWIGEHSEVQGKSKDPFRQMISFWVDDVYSLAEKLKTKNVEVLAGPGKSPDGSLDFLTIRDPELNMIQLFSKAK